MVKELTTEDLERLIEIKDEIKELVNEARDTINSTSEAKRARAYWCAYILCALDSDHDYLGGSMVTMQDSIDALAEEREA